MAHHQRALALDPDRAEAHYNLARVLRSLNRFDDAREHFQTALALDPNFPRAREAQVGIATAFAALRRYDEAEQCFEHLVSAQPDFALAKCYRALMYLSLGRFAEGWPLFESRWDAGLQSIGPNKYDQMPWSAEQVPGTLLIWGEQGLGDQILYASMVAEAASYATATILEVEKRLVALFARSFPGVQVVASAAEPYQNRFDAQVAIGSLGRFLRPSWQAFPRPPAPYLAADQAQTGALRSLLTKGGRAVIGLSWRSYNPESGRYKTARLADFAPLLRLPGYRFIDLQYGDTREERDAIARDFGVQVERLEDIDNTNDIDGLASLISACDAVVTVSNTTAHLAGALGKPTWVLVPLGHSRIWYWFDDQTESPWYPRVRVWRQGAGQSWAELIASATDQISAFVEAQ